ncbi:hypothetical protein N7501_008173 [Penicillium viridicatum]|nr:hypothetical protein N7501_008173 [Penicillium viridicatum]
MGDIDQAADRWMPPMTPQALPMGKANIYPSGERHSVSVSLPTWDSVIGLSRKEPWVLDQLECSYPRFYINKLVVGLSLAVLRRLRVSDSNTNCMLFASATAASKCLAVLRDSVTSEENPTSLETVRFFMPSETARGATTFHWANFSAVLLPSILWKKAMAFWRDTGSGLSTRHAEFCIGELDYLDSDSSNPTFCSPAPVKCDNSQSTQSLDRIQAAAGSIYELKSIIAEVATSDQPGEPAVHPDDVFPYPTGMNAIFSLSEALVSMGPESTVAAFGWLYPETVEVLRGGGWKSCLSYKYGTEEDLNQLENALQSGLKIAALFCELPSNILLSSPDLHRIRALADRFGFIVACDDTVAGFVNLDAIICVDVMVSSLTKTFSGSSNVTGGSLVVNPSSRHRDAIKAALTAHYEETYFPLDIAALIDNCKNMPWRVKRCNENTLPLVNLLSSHPSIATVHHPSTAPTSSLYQSVMRKDGGYGNVLSIIFHRSDSAEYFYNILDVCKGSSFGTNFTLVIPYVQLANYWNREKVPKYGVPQHILRISVGLEDSDRLVATIVKALKEVEVFESQNIA